jgi:hypothetical protein
MIKTHLTLVQSSMRYLGGHPWVAHALSLPRSIRYGRISFISETDDTTKFEGPHKSHMCQYIIKCFFNRAQPTRALIDTGGGYNLQSSKFMIQPLPDLPIRYSPLSASCPVWSHISATYHLFRFSTISIKELGYKKPQIPRLKPATDFY